MTEPHVQANIERFSGFAALYDRARPQPPEALPAVLTQLAQVERPALVVDLGSGTGLSTRLWAGRADAVVGVEPNADMRAQAEARGAELPLEARVSYRAGYSHETGLPDACADIVTVSQALHWMAPEPTFAEVARILRPGGLLAAYDCDWPPVVQWEAEAAYERCTAGARERERALGVSQEVRHWPKHEHLERMRQSGRFRYVRELLLHHAEQGDAERLVSLALSQSPVSGLLRRGVEERAFGLDTLRDVAARALGDTPRPWYFCYRVRIGIK